MLQPLCLPTSLGRLHPFAVGGTDKHPTNPTYGKESRRKCFCCTIILRLDPTNQRILLLLLGSLKTTNHFAEVVAETLTHALILFCGGGSPLMTTALCWSMEKAATRPAS